MFGFVVREKYDFVSGSSKHFALLVADRSFVYEDDGNWLQYWIESQLLVDHRDILLGEALLHDLKAIV